MKTIVVGTDGSPSSMQAVEHAATLASALQADLHIACAVRPPIEVASMNPMGAAFLPNWAEAANAEAAAAVARAAEVARQAGATAEGHVLNGEPATALIEFSERVFINAWRASGLFSSFVQASGRLRVSSEKRFAQVSVPMLMPSLTM